MDAYLVMRMMSDAMVVVVVVIVGDAVVVVVVAGAISGYHGLTLRIALCMPCTLATGSRAGGNRPYWTCRTVSKILQLPSAAEPMRCLTRSSRLPS